MPQTAEIPDALIQLVTEAMSSGAAYFAENHRSFDGRLLVHQFGEFPSQFLTIRTDLVEPVLLAFAGSPAEPVTGPADPDSASRAADAAVREIAAKYTDAALASFAINDFRDWLRAHPANPGT